MTKQWEICLSKDKYDLRNYHYKIKGRTIYRKPRDIKTLTKFMYIKHKDIDKQSKLGWNTMTPIMQMLTTERKYHKIGEVFYNYDELHIKIYNNILGRT